MTKELNELGNSEMWMAGKATRSLRPKDDTKGFAPNVKGFGISST